ncbi:MAG: hypothetical protein M1826_004978 [Phylliscum demangeonii]|nr:MAG: hypothetical protein M1826_004978 [Phylliscum demangeonii]
MFELHILGPGLCSPSLDAECNAAIGYLQLSLASDQWVLVDHSLLVLDPDQDLPLLKDDDDQTTVTGFRHIVRYLSAHPNGPWNLDGHLAAPEAADGIAYSSCVESHGRAVLDLLLYVTRENYLAVTRPACSALYPSSVLLRCAAPAALRRRAQARCRHLGFSTAAGGSLVLDDDDDDDVVAAKARDPVPIPASLFAQARTAGRRALGTGIGAQASRRMQLDAYARSFLDPLRALLGDKRYLLSDARPSSVDCLVVGQLSLALRPSQSPFPRPWLATLLRAEYPTLCAYVDELSPVFYGEAEAEAGVDAEAEADADADVDDGHVPTRSTPPDAETDAATRRPSSTVRRMEQRAVTQPMLLLFLLRSWFDSLPLIRHLRGGGRTTWTTSTPATSVAQKTREVPVPFFGLGLGLAGVAAGLLSAATWYVVTARAELRSQQPQPQHGRRLDGDGRPRRLADRGDAGAALAVLADQLDAQTQKQAKAGMA